VTIAIGRPLYDAAARASRATIALLLGVLAAGALGAGGDRRAYQDAVARLRTHPDATLAREAERVYGAWS
jgi:lipoprotein signal peptidase